MTKMTKSQLVDENTRLREHCAVLEQRLASLEAAQAPSAEREEPGARVPHHTYWEYVKARKMLAAAKGQRVATYKSRADWEAAVAAFHGSHA